MPAIGNALKFVAKNNEQIIPRCGIWLKDKYRFVRNRRGGFNLICKGFLYTAERKYNSTINWICNKNSNTTLRCPARCVTAGENAIKFGRRRHNHEALPNVDDLKIIL